MTSPSIEKIWRTARRMQTLADCPSWLPPLLFLTDRHRVSDPVAVAQSMPPGAGIILRDYDLPAREALAHALAKVCQDRQLVLLIGGDEDLAQDTNAHGVHLPQYKISQAVLLQARHPDWIVTGAAHDLRAIRRAEQTGLDAVLVSPVFATESHADQKGLGVAKFAALVRSARLPVYALGGIDDTNIDRLPSTQAVGVAAISGLAQSSD